jgi:hypothetical protein
MSLKYPSRALIYVRVSCGNHSYRWELPKFPIEFSADI